MKHKIKNNPTKVTKVKDRLYYVIFDDMPYYVDLKTKTITDNLGNSVPNWLKHKLNLEVNNDIKRVSA